MAYTGTFCTEAEAQSKEGANVSTSVTEAMHNLWAKEAEGVINTATRYNWTDAYATLSDDVKGILAEAASNLMACYAINYDQSSYFGNNARSMMQFLLRRFDECIFLLLDLKRQTFMVGEE